MIFNLMLGAAQVRDVVAISDQGIFDFNVDPGSASAQYDVNSDGTISYVTAVSGSGTVENWISPIASAGGNYEVRATKISGTNPTGSALATWLALSTGRSWTLSQTGTGTKACQLQIEIRDVATSTVQDSAFVDLSVEVTI